MQPVVRRPPAKRCAPLVPWPSLAPAVGNSRGCAEQFAHAPSRRRAVCVGGRVTRDAACGASAARKAVRPVGSLAHPCTHAACSGCVPAPGFCFPGLKLGLCFLRPVAGLCLSLARRRGLFSILSNRRRLVKQCVHYRLYSFFCLHKFYISCSISCGVWKRTVLPQWFSTFSTEFSTTPHRVLHRVSTLNI